MTGLATILLAACGPRPHAVIPGAARVAELANGELLVGTETGGLILVSSLGDVRPLAHRLPSAPVELVTDPLGGWHARLTDGRVFAGGLWTAPVQVAADARLLLRDCEETRWFEQTSEAYPDATTALGLLTCERIVTGTESGDVDGRSVSDSPIRHVQAVGAGVLWVDAAGRAGCEGCTSPVPPEGVVDATALHVPPFLPGEFAWVGPGGALWIDAD